MISAMTRTRMFFDTDEELKLAIQLEALKRGLGSSEMIDGVLRDHFKDALAEARKVLQQRKKKGEKE